MESDRYFFLTFLFIFQLLFIESASAQTERRSYSEFGQLLITDFSSSMFPHPERYEGHRFQDSLFFHPDTHYNDRSVAVFVPKHFKPGKKTNFVVYLHGWYNYVDSVLERYRLIEQFYESGKNAVLIVPQGPRMAPDSHAGNLEEPGGLQRLLNEALRLLKKEKVIKQRGIGTIILSGHSGAFRGIAFMLKKSTLKHRVKEVYLFDGLYSRHEMYADWLKRYRGRFVTIYTTDGAAEKSTEEMFELLRKKRIRFCASNDGSWSLDDLKREKVLFVYSSVPHDEVVYCSDQFRDLLKTSSLPDGVSPRK